MTDTAAPVPADEQIDPHHERRWLILGVIGIAQLLVVLDATIVNIALPAAQRDLGFSDASRQWVLTAYSLAFGSLLLLGGRLGDIFGRKRTFITGLIGFAVASAIGGAAPTFGILMVARVAQGMSGALLAPAALSLLATTFVDPKERGQAFGVYGAIAGGGGAVGLLLGGALTEYLDWRWCLYVGLVFAIPAAVLGARLLHQNPPGVRPKLDLVGAATSTGGLFALVYGFASAERSGWGAPITITMFVASVLLLALFVLLQTRIADPLLPMRIPLDRNRGGAYLAVLIAGSGIFGIFIFLTFYLQDTLGLSPLVTGAAFMALNVPIVFTAVTVNTRLLAKTGPRPLITTGMALNVVSLLLLTRLEVDSSYWVDVFPSLVITGVGFGLIFAPAVAGAADGVAPRDSGIASAMVNTSQQVGGSIGASLLSTIFASALAGSLADNPGVDPMIATVHGYTVAFLVAAGIFAVGAVVSFALLRPGVTAPAAEGAAMSMAH